MSEINQLLAFRTPYHAGLTLPARAIRVQVSSLFLHFNIRGAGPYQPAPASVLEYLKQLPKLIHMSKLYDSILAYLKEHEPCTLKELFEYSRRPSLIGFKSGMNKLVKSKFATFNDGLYAITPKGSEYLENMEGE